MDKIQTTKTIARLIVGYGAGRISGNIIRNNVPMEKATDKVAVPAASFVIGSMVSDSAGKHTDRLIDEAIDLWNQIKNVKN